MSDVLKRLQVLGRIIKTGSENLPWCGNIAMQKLVYLLEHVYGEDIGYTYGLHHLGPYSHELASDLSLGEQSHLWRGKTVQWANSNYSGKQYEICDDQLNQTALSLDTDWIRIEPAMKRLTDAVQNRTSRDLELYATIHYLRTIQEVTDEELWDVLHALKPKYSITEFEAGKRKVQEMEHEVVGYASAL